MGAKDLVLLMLIPILAVGIIFYTNNSPIITGAAAARTGTSENVIGTYSIIPSFKAKVDYDFEGEYVELKLQLSEAVSACKKRDDIEGCFKEKSDELGWACEEKEDSILSDFSDKLRDCKNLKEENVVCRLSFDKNGAINKGNGYRVFRIILSNMQDSASAELYEGIENLLTKEKLDFGLYYTGYDNKDAKDIGAKEIFLRVEYKDGNPSIDTFFAETEDNKKIELSKTILVYKAAGKLKFIDEAQQKGFEPSTPVNKIIDLPKIKGMKFCKKSNARVYAYDSSDKAVKLRDIIYRFAVTFPEPVPKPITGIKVVDAINAEGAAVLVWEESRDHSTKSYSIYYSKDKDFIKEKKEDIKKNPYVKNLLVSAENPAEIEKIDLSACIFDPIGKSCKYSEYGKPLEKNKLYYLKPKNNENGKFIYLLAGIKDNTEYNFAVTAVNSEGEEIGNDYSLKGNTYVFTLNNNYDKFASNDDLAPERISGLEAQPIENKKAKLKWNKPIKNLDGSDNKDLKWFRVYYKKESLLSGFNIKDDSTANEYATLQQASCDNPALTSCEYAIEGLENGEEYRFAVTALDSSSNEYKDDFDSVLVKIR
ncbi:fibronectin type III domain-containing protein [Candidatus Woesearchaeota archaeon]|nr:fibronectin type III domain-containing protein [Candidatus Woesearchaeota archaeon]